VFKSAIAVDLIIARLAPTKGESLPDWPVLQAGVRVLAELSTSVIGVLALASSSSAQLFLRCPRPTNDWDLTSVQRKELDATVAPVLTVVVAAAKAIGAV
jgi:hypothetical protein